MPFCTSCSRTLSSEEFIYESKIYKTCARSTIANTIDNLENHSKLSLAFGIRFDEVTLNTVGTDVKAIATLIIDEIESGDEYHWTATTAPNLSARYYGVGNAYYACSQNQELEREYKDSNRKRITRFNCCGKISIKIDIPLAEAKVFLKHEILHEKPIDIAMPPEVKQEIEKNLNLSPTDLRTHLRIRNFDLSKITYKQIHYWWSYYTQQFYKNDENHIISACKFFEQQQENNCNLCFHLDTDSTTAIGFTTSLLLASHYTEIHCDATYRTAKGRFELYGIVGNVEGTGFPVAYLILDTTKSNNLNQEGLRTEALIGFFCALRDRGLNPIVSENNEDYTINNPINNIVEPYDTNKSYEHIAATRQRLEPKVAALQRLVDHVNEEFSANNLQHVEAIINNLDRAFTILSDIEKEKNKKLRGTTWRGSKPWTIYLNNSEK
ncbi:ATP-dependent DNA helicase pif1 [Gigaspora margarita]|uniref:ATP-dependent DNA helicase pif1 n=1 Tax=Gigaspora margarita TaxID=4874 RepID=A0A8H3WWE4_GIGMA|nr:ATP-dependent DNA helicase pif1 [Gigaspora margarita]